MRTGAGSITIATTSVGTLAPIQLSLLADMVRFTVSTNTLSNAIQFSITLYFTDV